MLIERYVRGNNSESIVRNVPSPPTEKIFRITDSNISPSTRPELLPKGLLRADAELSRSIGELCEIEVLDFNKKPAELA